MKYRNYVKVLLEAQQNASSEESGNPEVSDPPGASAPLGLYAFAPQRIKAGEKGIPSEPNNEYEEQLYYVIKNHIKYNRNLDAEDTGFIKSFIENGWYKKIFKPAKSGVSIYRGQAISLKRLMRILGLKMGEKIPGFAGSAKVNYVWKSPDGKGYSSSWTINSDIAEYFSKKDASEERPVQIIFTAGPGQEKKFLDLTETSDGSGFYPIMGGGAEFYEEEEQLALDEINVSEINWKISENFKSNSNIVDNIDALCKKLCQNSLERTRTNTK